MSNYSSGNAEEEDSNPSSSDIVSSPAPSPGPFALGTSSAPTWSHLDMARPPHEDPEYQRSVQLCKRLSNAGINGQANNKGTRGGQRRTGNNIPNVFKVHGTAAATSNNQSTPLNLRVSGNHRGSLVNNKSSSTPNYKSLLLSGPNNNYNNNNSSSQMINSNYSSGGGNYKLINNSSNASQSYPSSNHTHHYHTPRGTSASSSGINPTTLHQNFGLITTTNNYHNNSNNSHNNNKYMKLDKSGQSILLNGGHGHHGGGKKSSGSSAAMVSPSSSSGRSARGGGETRKCRKVYGMQGRDSWCTQCKWKKACTRFTNASKASSTSSNVQHPPESKKASSTLQSVSSNPMMA